MTQPNVPADVCTSMGGHRVFDAWPARQASLGNLPIRRALPVRDRRMIGPWCFLDRYGPLSFSNEKPMDVAPHPHIGLQTVSWLLEGEVVHNDSLGFEAVARPGAANVMTAGSGIAHSEETPASNVGRLSGVQLWIALPDAKRNIEPAFQHVAAVPRLDYGGGNVQLIAGEMSGVVSPADAFSDLIAADVEIHAGQALESPLMASREHGLFVLSGDVSFESAPLLADTMYYLGRGRSEMTLSSAGGARVLLVGGEPFAETVLMWWNFVARTPEEIVAAREAWERGERFGAVSAYRGPRIPAPSLSRIARPNPAS